MLRGIQALDSWEPIEDAGRIIGLTRGTESISLEPGGQFELSGAPLEDLHATRLELAAHLRDVHAVAAPLGLGFSGMGFHPLATREAMPWMPKSRYAIMRRYMPLKGSMGLDMMLRTATVQVNLDFGDEADMVEKLRVSLALQPLATALFAPRRCARGGLRATARCAVMCGRTPMATAPASPPASSRTASASSASPSTCWTCRCISWPVRARCTTWLAPPSASSWRAASTPCPARWRRWATWRTT
jgi:hypothetical protein